MVSHLPSKNGQNMGQIGGSSCPPHTMGSPYYAVRRLLAGRDGRFALVTEDRHLPAEVLAYPSIHITPVTSALATIGHTLAFPDKLDLFRFLVSSEGALLTHLQFQEELVVTDKAEEASSEGMEELATKSCWPCWRQRRM